MKLEKDECTQVSDVSGNIFSVFGSDANNHFDYSEWYKQLFELKDYEERE